MAGKEFSGIETGSEQKLETTKDEKNESKVLDEESAQTTLFREFQNWKLKLFKVRWWFAALVALVWLGLTGLAGWSIYFAIAAYDTSILIASIPAWTALSILIYKAISPKTEGGSSFISLSVPKDE